MIGTQIVNLKTVKNPTIEDSYGVAVIFKCLGCHQEYSIVEYRNPEGEEFLESLANDNPNRNIFCTKCNPIN